MERGPTKYHRLDTALLSLWSREPQCALLSSHSGWHLGQYCCAKVPPAREATGVRLGRSG